ncbi:MAG TPA: RNA polymerase-binding protein RbpA [Mycobacteriales bacterium]|nr:RNA polymerase-binding protein RbpA [Mycobacteriales bacterium]
MKRRSGMRGNRLVSASNQIDRGGEPAARRVAHYWCASDHHTSAAFAADIEPPTDWPCQVCSGPASLERGSAPAAVRPRFFPRTPYEFLMMRRTEEDGERILAEALAAMRAAGYPLSGVRPRPVAVPRAKKKTSE